MIAAILWIGAKLVIEDKLTVGPLIAFNMVSGQVNHPILRLAQIWHDFQQFRICLNRLGDVPNVPAEPAQSPQPLVLPVIRGDIIFDLRVFRYSIGGLKYCAAIR